MQRETNAKEPDVKRKDTEVPGCEVVVGNGKFPNALHGCYLMTYAWMLNQHEAWGRMAATLEVGWGAGGGDGEQMELLAFVTGLQVEGVGEYRGPFVDFMLEYLKHNLDKAPRRGVPSQVPAVSEPFMVPWHKRTSV